MVAGGVDRFMDQGVDLVYGVAQERLRYFRTKVFELVIVAQTVDQLVGDDAPTLGERAKPQGEILFGARMST